MGNLPQIGDGNNTIGVSPRREAERANRELMFLCGWSIIIVDSYFDEVPP